MNVAVIPARGGSKRIPRKNVKPFCGRPMLEWSIAAALRSACFSRVIVSTDDGDIAEIARAAGAEAPFVRPAELADDHTGTVAVMRHAVRWLEQSGARFENVCCIYPTAPFILSTDIDRGLGVLSATGAAYAVSVTSYAYPIERALRMAPDSRVRMLKPEHLNTRSQDLEEAYHDAAQFYWGRAAAWREGWPIFLSDAAGVILPRYRVHDIDTLEDWTRAELVFRALESGVPGNSHNEEYDA